MKMQNAEEGVTILMAEDDDGHALLLRQRLESAGARSPILRFDDGRETWDFLSGAAKPGLEPGKAYLLLLDIRMPSLDGVEVLRRMKRAPRLAGIPVIIITTTDDPGEMARCRELGCADYLVKPAAFERLFEVITRLGLPLTTP